MPSTCKECEMYFSKLVNFRKKPNKEIVEGNSKRKESEAKEGN